MEIKSINQFQLGDCIGKGAFGSVYRALNLENGEVVAIKQLKLNKISKSELDVIMTEIDLLKKLKHPNIVKYYGFIKTKDFLNIILEYCENGSLQTIYKRFGQFPENLVAVYISQVLDGLLYLHEQGVIHRDIKGPNILTTKDGSAKLADFGVATCMGENADKSVVGSPYWMAPEVIELNGATTASDIWSVGCTTIELLSGEPPYYNLSPMSALFRIVEDEHPPIMEGISSALKDFLLQCFQKDYNLRISAKKLLKHPWIQNARKKLNSDVENIGCWDEQINTVKKWNEALTDIDKNPVVLELPQQSNSDRPIHEAKINNILAEPENEDENWDEDFQYESIGNTEFMNKLQFQINNNASSKEGDKDKENTIKPKSFLSETESSLKASSISLYNCKEGVLESWDDDFDVEDEESQLDSSMSYTITPGNYKNLKKEEDMKKVLFEKKRSSMHQNESNKNNKNNNNKNNKNKITFNMYVEDESDNNDFEDISWTEQDDLKFQKIKTTKGFVSFSTADDEDDDDPFSDICEEFNEIELEKNIQKEKVAKLTAEIKQHIISLSSTNIETFTNSTQKLKTLFTEQPDLTNVLITNHFILPIIDVLEKSKSSQTITEILELVKIISLKNNEFQEHFILLGGLPLIISYAEMQYEHKIRYLASFIIQTICKNTKSVTFQTFISCRGLPALVALLGGDYSENKDLIFMTIDSIYDIFELQNSTPKSDYLQLFIKCDLIPNLLDVMNNIIVDDDIFDAEEYENKIVNIFLKFSRGDAAIKEAVATKEAIESLLKEIDKLYLRQSINILKALKNLSSDSSTLDNLFNAGIIPKLINFINIYKDDEKYQEISNQVLNIIYNLCRINKNRQESAAQAGVVPILQEYVYNPSPLKEFALPVLCEMVHAGKVTRDILWENNVLNSYILLMKDTFWQINAIDAIFAWLLEDPLPIESVLQKHENIEILINAINLCCSTNSKFDTKFVNFLEILQKLMFISKPINERITIVTLEQFSTLGIQFFGKLVGKLLHPNALVKVNILRILNSMFECLASEKKRELYRKLNNNYDILIKLDSLMNDSAILVKDLVTNLKNNLEEFIEEEDDEVFDIDDE